MTVRVLKTDKMISHMTVQKGNKLLQFSVGFRMIYVGLMSWKTF